MGIYLDIVRKAVHDYRRDQQERRAGEERDPIVKTEEIVLRDHSDGLRGEEGTSEDFVNSLVSWSPHNTERDVVEDAGRAASEQMANSQNLHDMSNRPVQQGSCEGAVDQVQAADHQVEHDGVGTNPEADEPEIEIEVQPLEEPAGFDPYGDDEGEMDQALRVAEVLREHRERQTWDADKLVEEGFFHDKLDFEPTTAIVEEAQCMLLLPEG